MIMFKGEIFKVKAWRLFFIFLLMSFITKGQNPSLTTSVNKQNILIGEHLQYVLEARIPTNTYQINWLNIPDSINHFDEVENQKTDSSENGGMLSVKRLITITSFDSGVWTIPSFEVNFVPIMGNKAFDFFTDSVRINVSFSPLDSTKTFHDIKTIIEVKDEWPIWMWIVAIAAALLLAALIYYIVRKLTKKKQKNVFTSKLSPLEEAMQALTELQKQELLANGEVKHFHSRLSDVFKRYISRKTGSDVFSLTTEENLISLNEMHTSKENMALIANTLRMSDAVKFAKYIPGISESEAALSDLKKAIQLTDQSITNNKSDI